jgi:phosphoglycolate phosphatase
VCGCYLNSPKYHSVTRLVLFDIDGTLIHTHKAGVRAFINTLRSEFDIDNPSQEISFAGRTDKSLVREFFTIHGILATEENFSRFFEAYVFWLDYMLRRTQGEIGSGVDHFVNNLNSLKEPPLIGLLTGNIRLGAEIKLRHFYLWDYFKMGVFGDENECRDKLAALALERGRDILGPDLAPEEVIVIGDTVFDVKCAQSIGARSLAISSGACTAEELSELNPTWLVPNMNKVQVRMIME